MKNIFLLITFSLGLTITSCATPTNTNYNQTNNSVDSYGNTPDNPMVNSREASSAEFPQENQF